jgi:hypothetical protein
MKEKAYFQFRIDIWDDDGSKVVDHVAYIDDFELAEATYQAAVKRWPNARVLRQDARTERDGESDAPTPPHLSRPPDVAPARKINSPERNS